MAESLNYNDWLTGWDGDGDPKQKYLSYLDTMKLFGNDASYTQQGVGVENGGAAAPGSKNNIFAQYKIDLEAQNKQNQQLRPNIQPYGYQPTDYGNTTPNSNHWLNTMNAFAPTARSDMDRLLGTTTPAKPQSYAPPTPSQPAPNYLTPAQYPFQRAGAPDYMADFYNTPGTAYTQQASQAPAISQNAPNQTLGTNSALMTDFYGPGSAYGQQQNTQTGGLLQIPGTNSALMADFFGPGSAYGLLGTGGTK